MTAFILKNEWFYTFLYVSATLNVQKSKFSQNFLQKPLLNECKNLIFGFLSLCLLSTCKPSECFFANGNIKKEFRQVGFFHKLFVYDNISVELTEGEQVWVEAGENLLPLLQTELQADSTLILRNDAKCNWLRSYNTPIKIYVGAKNLSYIRWESYGKLESKIQIPVAYLQVEVLGVNALVDLNLQAIGVFLFANVGADFKVSGKTSDLGIFMMNYSRADALNLESQQANIRQESSNHIWVNATQKIEGSISGYGNIFYKTHPNASVNISATSSGRAVALP